MNKRILSLMIMALLPFNAIANSCKIEGYTIGFFNGVATTETQAKLGLKKIKSTLDISQYKGESVEYQLFYNDSYIEGSGLNVLADFAETFAQRTYELEQKQFDRWEAFWDIVNDKQNSSIIKKISAAFSWFEGFVRDSVSLTRNALIREFLEALTLLVDSPDTSQTRMQHHLINDSHTWKGKKLIYIAHSQGNLWVNESYKHVTSQRGYGADNIRVIHIAPASPTLSPDSGYILSSSDMVINGLHFTGRGSVPPPNTMIAPSKSDLLGHGLIEIYLTEPKSIKKIQASVDKAFASITKPDMQDFLFKIEFNHSTNFNALFENPVYDIVDAAGDGNRLQHSRRPDDYLSRREGSWLKRYVDSNIKEEDKLPFRVDDNAVIVFDTCTSPNEVMSDTPSIPAKDIYKFIQFQHLKSFESGTFKDIWWSRKMTDRYGLVDKKHAEFEDMNGWYFDYTGVGEGIELEVTQHFYNEQQRKYLSKHQLSGRYDVSAYSEKDDEYSSYLPGRYDGPEDEDDRAQRDYVLNYFLNLPNITYGH